MLPKASKTNSSPDSLMRSIKLFNEKDYLRCHQDVEFAVRRGDYSSGFDHYLKYGILEGRFPGFHGFDHIKYLARNPDVADSLKSKGGDMRAGARDHFRRSGYAEGRSRS